MITNSHNASGTIPRPHHPHRRSSLPNKRSHGSSNQSSQSIFVGLSLALDKEREGRVAWELAVSDGFGMIGTEHGEGHGYDFSEGGDGVKTCVETLVHRLRDFEVTQGYNIQFVSIASPLPQPFQTQLPLLMPTFWEKLDTIPFLAPEPSIPLPSSPKLNKHIPLDFLPKAVAEEEDAAPGTDSFRAKGAIHAALNHLAVSIRSATTVQVGAEDREVKVDGYGRKDQPSESGKVEVKIQLAGLNDYEASSSQGVWEKFTKYSNELKDNKTTVSFFSATPQGGGVALMRHALLRLWRLAGVEVSWYVPEGHGAIFNVTKRKFHNVLQGVNEEGIKLEESDKSMFEGWTKANMETFWNEKDGPLDASVIVIDDPQLAALIPFIRKRTPEAKIIYRSHIQIDTSLVNDPKAGGGVHADVWNYLWSFIKDADVFVAHPVKAFVPQNVLDSKMPIVYMAPSTDPLDGLNKPIGKHDMRNYQGLYVRLSRQQCGVAIDFERPYIIQVARFDPSKGIPILLAAYLSFRNKLKEIDTEKSDTPQLVICGHGSVDDPDGQPVFEEIHEILSSEDYSWLKDDVSVVRVPPCDRTLGAILQGAWCATQLSTKEGFEVKVTEAIAKGIPIVCSDAGGIPLQVRDKVNGWIVPSGDHEAVAKIFLELHQSPECPLPAVAALIDPHSSPNERADALVSSLLSPPPKINPHAPSSSTPATKDAPTAVDGEKGGEEMQGTSEDFWTVGNAAKWEVLWQRLAGVGEEGKKGREGVENGKGLWEGMEGRNVWEVILGKKEDELIIG